MKKEIIICIVVLIAVIVGNVITQNHTKECVEIMNAELTDLKEKMLKEEKNDNDAMDKIESIKQNWTSMQEGLAYYIEHDELEKVETELHTISGQIEAKEYKETLPEIEKCIFILEHIKDKTALNIKNIF